MKRIFVAGTVQNAGKTTICLGLYRAAAQRGYNPCFMKPLGQRYRIEDGQKVDEDAVLFKHALAARGYSKDLNPVSISPGYTREYVFNRDAKGLKEHITEAFDRVCRGCDLAIIEGTGHAGVGSVVDASNAAVASLLDASCVLVAGGGIGSTIDSVRLNRALFREENVPVIGAIVNKVWKKKYHDIAPAVRRGLKNQGVDSLGIIPYEQELASPTLRQVMEELGTEVWCGSSLLDNKVRNMVVGAISPQNMINRVQDGSLIIVPGDRIDNILASVNSHLLGTEARAQRISGILLTDGFSPPEGVEKLMCKARVPVLLTDKDTASATYETRNMVVKIGREDTNKIQMAEELVVGRDSGIDVEALLEAVPALEGEEAPTG